MTCPLHSTFPAGNGARAHGLRAKAGAPFLSFFLSPPPLLQAGQGAHSAALPHTALQHGNTAACAAVQPASQPACLRHSLLHYTACPWRTLQQGQAGRGHVVLAASCRHASSTARQLSHTGPRPAGPSPVCAQQQPRHSPTAPQQTARGPAKQQPALINIQQPALLPRGPPGTSACVGTLQPCPPSPCQCLLGAQVQSLRSSAAWRSIYKLSPITHPMLAAQQWTPPSTRPLYSHPRRTPLCCGDHTAQQGDSAGERQSMFFIFFNIFLMLRYTQTTVTRRHAAALLLSQAGAAERGI